MQPLCLGEIYHNFANKVSHNALRNKRSKLLICLVKWVGEKLLMTRTLSGLKYAASARLHKHTFTQLHNEWQEFLQKVTGVWIWNVFSVWCTKSHCGCIIYWYLISYPLILGIFTCIGQYLKFNVACLLFLHLNDLCCHLTFTYSSSLKSPI